MADRILDGQIGGPQPFYVSPAVKAVASVLKEVQQKQGSDIEKSEGYGIKTGTPKTPPQIVASQNDYDTDIAETLRISTDASRTITGFAGGSRGRSLRIVNTGSFNVVINNQDAGSIEANRVIVPGGVNLTLTPNQAVQLWYDKDSLRWRVLFSS